MWRLLFFVTRSPVASLTIRLTPTNSDGVPLLLRQGIEDRERIYTYIDAVSYLLNSYATDDVIAKAASEIESCEKYNNNTAVQFVEALKDKALKCEDTIS